MFDFIGRIAEQFKYNENLLLIFFEPGFAILRLNRKGQSAYTSYDQLVYVDGGFVVPIN